MKNKYTLLLLLLTFFVGTKSILAQQPRVVPFLIYGGRVDWAKKGIAYDVLDSATGYYQLAVVQPDGSGFTDITKGVANIPQKNNGNPAWYYPTGRYIVYEAEKDSNYNPADEYYGISANAVPGIGLDCDLWVVDLQTMVFTRLTDLATKRTKNDTTPITGLLHPQFSHDGNKLIWSQCLNIADTSRGTALPGLWELNMADFDTTGGVPKLTNIVNYTSGGVLGDFTFLETSGGFSPDDSTIIYCANAIPGQLAGYMDIYSFNIYTQQLKNLTPDTDVWDEHSHFTYDGNNILWMNSEGYDFVDDVTKEPRTDYWMMDKDGSNKRKVTFFNTRDSAEHIYADGGIVTVGDNAWSPFGGDSAICYVQIFGTSTYRSDFYLINAQQTISTAITALPGKLNGLKYYPNPAKDNITLDLRGLSSGPIDITIYGAAGNLLYSEQINSSQQLQTISTKQFAGGIYFIEAVSGRGVWNGKLVIE